MVPNYVRTSTFQSAIDSVTSINFSDGLNKSVQTQLILGDNVTALISAKYYDVLGRDSLTTKSFAYHTEKNFFDEDAPHSSWLNAANNYWSSDSIYPGTSVHRPSGGGKAYSEIAYYDDPLNRPSENGAPGASFYRGSGHTSQMWYYGVASNDAFLTFDQLKTVGSYEPNPGDTFYNLIITKDPNGKFTQEIKDNVYNHTLSTWAADTVTTEHASDHVIISKYLYDVLGKVTIEQPLGTPGGVTNYYENIYYTYDKLGRLITKKTPDAGTVSYAYDKADRLIEVTPANAISDSSTGRDYYISYVYDDLGRNIKIQKAFPPGTATPPPQDLIRNIYDDPSALSYYSNISAGIISSLQNCKGRLVAAIAFNNDIIPTSNFTLNLVFDIFSYDDEGRIQTKYKIVPGLANQTFSYEYDFQSKVTIERYSNGPLLTTEKQYFYDALGRLSEIKLKKNNENAKVVADFTYTAAGLCILKDLKDLNDGTQGALVTSEYTIRDWVAKINSISKPLNVPIFGEQLFYENSNQPYTEPSPYNGNISQIVFSYTSVYDKRFSYYYDDLNRLRKVNDDFGNSVAYNELFQYDKIGRITRKLANPSTFPAFPDNPPEYQYSPTSNQLQSITGKRDKTAGEHFNYVYDANGNMILDRYKKMVVKLDFRDMPYEFVFYNTIPDKYLDWLNLYSEVDKANNNGQYISKVVMHYDASGNRVLKTTLKGGF